MKKTFMLAVAVCCLIFNASATIHVITVADMQFTPASLTIPLGDTVKWVWMSGTHTTTSVTIPTPGAVPWDQSIAAAGASYTYKPAVAGTYNYKCTFHASMGMVGSFTVTPPAGVSNVSLPVFNMFPNPASGSLQLQFNELTPAIVALTDINGAVVFQKKYPGAKELVIDLKNIPSGQYIITVLQGDRREQQELVIGH